MGTVRFSRQEFEDQLPKNKNTGEQLWTGPETIKGELVYTMEVTGTNKRLRIRSSINGSGFAAETGADSIRIWAEYFYKNGWRAMKKIDAWTTRQPGWDTRMIGKLRELYQLALDDSKKFQSKPAPTTLMAQMSEAAKAIDKPVAKATPVKQTAFTPSTYQQAIMDAVLKTTDNLQVVACPGSGKSTTLKWIATEAEKAGQEGLAILTFAKALQEEMAVKMTEAGSSVSVRTCHSLGFGNNKRAYPHSRKQDNKTMGHLKALLDAEYPDRYNPDREAIWSNRWSVISLVEHLRYQLAEPTTENMERLAIRFGIDTNGEQALIFSFTRRVYDKVVADNKSFDFTDMIFWTASGKVAPSQVGTLFIDESQDFNPAMIEFTLKTLGDAGRAIVVGDPNQCQPTGTMVYKTGVGYVPIETIQAGDEMLSYTSGYFPGKNTQGRKVLAIASREYHGEMIHLKAGDYEHAVTPNHRCFTRMVRRNGWAVYIVKRGNQARVGMTKSANNPAGSVAIRGRQEGADSGWILGIFDNYADAALLENRVAYQYGIPQLCFQRKWEVKETTVRKQEWLDKFWHDFPPIGDKLAECLEDFGRDIRYPFWTISKNGGERGKKCGAMYAFVTQACNLISGWMRVCTFSGSPHVRTEDWKEVEVSRSHYDGMVHSLKLETINGGHPLYVAQGIVTHNSIYGFMGADSKAMDRFKVALTATELPLSICYRCDVAIVRHASEIFTDIEARPNAPEGLVSSIKASQLTEMVTSGDLVLCRTNAPMVRACYDTIRAGKKAYIVGRDIGTGLVKLIDRMVEKHHADSIVELVEALTEYKNAEMTKLEAMDKAMAAQAVEDKVDTIVELTDGVYTVAELKDRIANIFDDSDDKAAIRFSTVHRAKGTEADRVFILKPELMPFPKATSDEDVQQEQNIIWVARTRAKHELYYVASK